jgi:DNA-binding transcriptional ArsR family regulator
MGYLRGLKRIRSETMRSTKVQTMTTIAAIIRKYKKKYCTASQQKLIELLSKYYGVKIELRMLNYHLKDLREAGLIKSIKRSYRNRDGTFTLNTSATCLTPLGYHELWKLGSEWAKTMWDKLRKKYFPAKASKVEIPAPVSREELDRRRALGRAMFTTEAYKRAFGVDG